MKYELKSVNGTLSYTISPENSLEREFLKGMFTPGATIVVDNNPAAKNDEVTLVKKKDEDV